MGSEKHAKARVQTANTAAEHATLQSEVLEAKIQIIQAQVEPHFLFNTMASVEYLIETNPPRVSAMQKPLIPYLRAGVGRGIDIVKTYLDLLKMCMK